MSGPMWSRDGSQLVFAEGDSAGSTIWRMPSTGGARSFVAQSALQPYPAWSADGREIFYEDTDPSSGTGSVLYRASLAGAGARPFSGGARFVQWAHATNSYQNPDEFAVEDGPGHFVYTFSSAGHDFSGSAPDFTPDRTRMRIVFERGGDIFVWDGLTDTETPITSGPEQDSEPVFSPSGTRVAFVREVAGKGDIWTVNVDGSGAAPLVQDAIDERSPDWGVAYTPPQVTINSPQSYQDVDQFDSLTASYSCGAGTLSLRSCEGVVDSTPVADGQALPTRIIGWHTLRVQAEDTTGNRTVVLHSYLVHDRTPPVISIASPVEGAAYVNGHVPAPSYFCFDPVRGSGIAQCQATDVASNATTVPGIGAHEFTVRATDNEGNAASRVVHYRVVYAWTGFLPASSGWRSAMAGQKLALGFSLGGYAGAYPLLELPTGGRYPVSVDVAPCTPQPPTTPPAGTQSQTVGGLSYDPVNDRYTYVWKTDPSWAGTCRLFVIDLNDGTEHTTGIQFS
jgi:WD40-like Beta Propeller Repeat